MAYILSACPLPKASYVSYRKAVFYSLIASYCAIIGFQPPGSQVNQGKLIPCQY